MTIPEAVSLVMTAGSMAHGGEIFVLDMGDPVKIKDLAENLIRLSGFIPNKDIKIKFVGMRPGEKLYEELLISSKKSQKTENNKIFVEYPSKLDKAKFLNDLEKLALSYPGVVKTYAIQAGRELRVIVGAEKVTDQEADQISLDLSKKIQNEMTYPGQIKITVIRETRAVNYAR